MRYAALALAIAALLALSGCLDSLPADQRLYCLDLAEKSYAFVPECSSQQECFSLLQNQFFGFDSSVFSSQVQAKLYSYKNNVALSWLHFNRARQSISSIREICSRNTRISDLLFHLNELTHSMSKAFEFSGLAGRESFAVLLIEHSELQSQDIALVKEEPLFNDFSLIADNLNQLSGSNCSSQNYACFYLKQTKEFEALTVQTGFQNRVVSEANAFDLLQPGSSAIGSYIGSELSIPFIGTVLPSLVSYLANFFTARDALEGLQRTPAFQFMQSYSGFVGTENSCLTKFAAIVEGAALHRGQLMQRNKELEEKAEQGIRETQQSIDSLLSRNYASFDQNFFQRLYSGLGQESRIAAQKYSIRDFGEFREEAEEELASLKQRLRQLQGQEALQQLSLGQKASSLKQLNSEIKVLQENLDYLSSEVIQGLLVLCEERSLFIEQQLEQAILPQEYLVRASDLKARAKFRLAQFREAEEKEQRLLQCSEMAEEFASFSKAMQDFENYSLQEETSLQKCFSFLDRAFEAGEANSFDFESLLFRFRELQQIEKPYLDIDSVKRICLSLETGMRAFLQRQAIVMQIEQDFASSKQLLPGLELAEAKGIVSSPRIEGFKSQMLYFEGFFSSGTLSLEKALPVLQDLGKSLAEFLAVLEEELRNAVLSYAEQSAAISVEQAANPIAGLSFNETITIEFENPFSQPVTGPLVLSLPFQKNAGSLLVSSPNVLSFESDGKSLSVDLNGLPEGKTMLSFSTADIVSKSESLELLSASSAEALFSKKIEVECARPVEKLQVRTELLSSSQLQFAKVSVLQLEASLPFSQSGKNVSFFLENCSGKQQAAVIFSVLNPVEVKLELIEELDQPGGKLFTYAVEAKNRLPIKLDKFNLILPTNFSEKTASGIELFDKAGKKLKFSMLPNGNISLASFSLLPMHSGIALFLRLFSEETAPIADTNSPTQSQEKNLQDQAQAVSKKISELESLVGASEQKLASLGSLFAAVSDEQLISAKYIPPISRQELDKLKLKLSSLSSFLAKKDLQNFSSLNQEGKLGSALEKSNKFEAQLDEKLLEAGDIASRLDNAFSAIKEDAVVSYNSAVQLFNQSPNPGAEESIEQAKEQLLKGNYLESIASSKNATGLLSLGLGPALELPVFVWPIAVCAGLVLVVRFKKKKSAKQKKELLKQIESNW